MRLRLLQIQLLQLLQLLKLLKLLRLLLLLLLLLLKIYRKGSTAGFAAINIGPKTRIVVDIVVMMTCSEGPAVSLKGSPTVSPVTAAWCCKVFFSPLDSINFLALSHAPPALSNIIAMVRPVSVPNNRKPATHSTPNKYRPVYEPTKRKKKPIKTGIPNANKAGFLISLSAALVTIV